MSADFRRSKERPSATLNNWAMNLQINTHLTSLEIMASLIAAVTHDLDHPGVNQPFLVATSNHLAALYQVSNTLL